MCTASVLARTTSSAVRAARRRPTQYTRAPIAISTSDDPTAGGFVPTRTLSWALFDGAAVSDVETTVITITAVNDPPVAQDGSVTGDESDHVVFFQTPAMILALWDRRKLAEDSGVEDVGGWGGATLAYNVRSADEVDEVIEEARAAGAAIPREPAKTFWGGYSGVFVDPDGFPWEVAHNPRWTIHEDGRTTLD